MLFDSWDGDWGVNGTDSFAVAFNGETVFNEIFFAHLTERNFRAADEIPGLNAYNTRWVDNIYRNITIEIDIEQSVDHITLDFIGSPNQSINDESWGLDNVLVERLSTIGSVPEVPAPSSLLLLGSGFGLVTRRKR